MTEAPKEEMMKNSRPPTSLLTCALVVAISGSALCQSLAPGEATPEPPKNPYSPPPCTGTVFNDVTCSTNFDAWIEQYASDQITGGCGGGNYCPGSPVTRAQMAVFVEKAMRGTGTWSPGDLANYNTGLGFEALRHNTFAGYNTAIGDQALWTQSFDNGGSSWYALNTAVGWKALYANQPTSASNGLQNTAIGAEALESNTTGSANVAVGAAALLYNTTGIRNVALGYSSLFHSMGDNNTAVGENTLFANTTGSNNTAAGELALSANTTGFDNTAIGRQSGARSGQMITGYAGSPVTFVSTQTGNYNTFLGISGSTADVDNCTAVGMDAYCDATNQVRLGNYFVTSIGGKVGWSALSDARAKSDIQDLDLGLSFVLALRPVSYRYKSGNGRIDMGFVGQDVESLLGEGYNVLDVGGDAERTLSIRYSELIAPLVKAVQEQQAEIETRDARIASLEEQARFQRTRVDALEQELETLLGRSPATSASGR